MEFYCESILAIHISFRLGFLDVEEFALAMHLINVKLDGNELPNSLPEHLVPPSQRLNGVE